MTQNAINIVKRMVNFASSTTNTKVTCNVVIPLDDTIPQNTEGVEVLTCSITPISTLSTLLITTSFSARIDTLGGNNRWIGGVFQDSTANALAASTGRQHTTGIIRYIMTSGTTSSTTFKLRIGPNAGGTCYVNGDTSGNRVYGGVSYAIMTIEEYL